MQKIVINRCFGGFGLSRSAVKEYGRRKGLKIRAYENARIDGGLLDMKRLVPLRDDDPDPFVVHYATGPLKDGAIPDAAYFDERAIPRDDADLVAVVKRLGEAANGRHARLRIVSVPDGVKWEIAEYDGLETIHEVHGVWS